MNTSTTATQSTLFTIRFDSIKVNRVQRHKATVYANGKKVYSSVSNDRTQVRQEVNNLVRNLTLYGYSPEKPVGLQEEIWYLFRELKDTGKLNHQIRAAVLLQRHTWTNEQALTMLDTLKRIKNA